MNGEGLGGEDGFDGVVVEERREEMDGREMGVVLLKERSKSESQFPKFDFQREKR